MFTSSEPIDVGLPHAHCARCDTEVLVYTDLDQQGELSRHCLDCGDALEAIDAQALWNVGEVVDAGYVVEGYVDPDQKGSCGDGGCSGGSCSH